MLEEKNLKNQKMRINLEKCSLSADLDICISSSKITICKDILIQQKE